MLPVSMLPRKIVMFCFTTFTVAIVVLLAGCGDETQTATKASTSTTNPAQKVRLNRISPEAIQVTDFLNDVVASNEKELPSAPQFIDINTIGISREGENLKLTMDVAAALPQAPVEGKAVEWGFLLDSDQDGVPEWGVFASLDVKNGWYYALSNQKTGEKQAVASFPGTFSQSGTTMTWTLNQAAINSPQGFRWLSFANYYAQGPSGKAEKASDTIPDQTPVDQSDTWPMFP